MTQEELVYASIGLLIALLTSETLPFIKFIKGNGILQIVLNVIMKGMGR